MKSKNFSGIKNALYIIYLAITAFFLMNDYKLTTLILMLILAPVILLMEHYESIQRNSRESEEH